MRATISDVAVGDRIQWAGRSVEVRGTKHSTTYYLRGLKRPSRYLMCEVEPGKVLRLHYYDDEIVEIARRETV